MRYLLPVDVERARAALRRASLVFCKRRPEMHIFAAQFEESQGNVSDARDTYKHVVSELSPGLLSAIMAAANFERRQGDRVAACSFYEDIIQDDKTKQDPQTYAFVSMQYAYFLHKQYNALESLRAVYREALVRCPDIKALWEGAIFFEESAGGSDVYQRVKDLYTACTAPPPDEEKGLSTLDREEFSLHSIDCADMYGSAADVLEAKGRHEALFPLSSLKNQNSRKRANETTSTPAGKHQKVENGTVGNSAAVASSAMMASGAMMPPSSVSPAGYFPSPTTSTPPDASQYAYPYGYQQYPSYGYNYGYQ